MHLNVERYGEKRVCSTLTPWQGSRFVCPSNATHTSHDALVTTLQRLRGHQATGVFQLQYNLKGPRPYMRSTLAQTAFGSAGISFLYRPGQDKVTVTWERWTPPGRGRSPNVKLYTGVWGFPMVGSVVRIGRLRGQSPTHPGEPRTSSVIAMRSRTEYQEGTGQGGHQICC